MCLTFNLSKRATKLAFSAELIKSIARTHCNGSLKVLDINSSYEGEMSVGKKLWPLLPQLEHIGLQYYQKDLNALLKDTTKKLHFLKLIPDNPNNKWNINSFIPRQSILNGITSLVLSADSLLFYGKLIQKCTPVAFLKLYSIDHCTVVCNHVKLLSEG